MIRLLRNGGEETVGLRTATEAELLIVLFERAHFGRGILRTMQGKAAAPYVWDGGEVVICDRDTRLISRSHRSALFKDRFVEEVRYVSPEWAALMWRKGAAPGRLESGEQGTGAIMDVAVWPDPTVVAASVHEAGGYHEHVVANGANRLVQWMMNVQRAARSGDGVTVNQAQRLMKLVIDAATYGTQVGELEKFLERWSSIRELPAALKPPFVEMPPEAFPDWRSSIGLGGSRRGRVR
jgi:hypothetical protein